MGIWGHKVPKYHAEIFGNEDPHSMPFIILKLTDFWEMHPIRSELTTLFQLLSEERQGEFREKYVTEIPIEGLEDIAPATHFDPGVHRSSTLLGLLKKTGKIKDPPVVYFGMGLPNDAWKAGFIYEGKHRVGAAALLKWKTIPAFVLHTVGKLQGSIMTLAERAEMGREQTKRGLPNSSRIHGLPLRMWTEKELRTFMFPTPQNKSQYYVQDMNIANCKLGHPGWEGVPRGVVIREVPLPWDGNHLQ